MPNRVKNCENGICNKHMVYMHYVAWMIGQAAGALLFFWPVTAMIFCGVTVALLKGSRPRLPQDVPILIYPLMCPAVMLLLGAWIGYREGAFRSAAEWLVYIPGLMVFAQLVISVWIVMLLKGRRWFAGFTLGLEQCFGIACALIATSAISGDWL